jgi:hypothetical protein
MSERDRMTKDLPGEWSMIAARISLLLDDARTQGQVVRIINSSSTRGVTFLCSVAFPKVIHTDPQTKISEMDSRDDIVLAVHIGELEHTTHIDASVVPTLASLVQSILDDVEALTQRASVIRRYSIGATFNEILNEYYERRGAGEKVKLSRLAKAARVNYDSLRQYKVRYDKEREDKTVSRD